MQTTTDLFKSVLQNEVRANLFYAQAAEQTTDDNARMLFLELSNTEECHLQRIIEVAHAHNLGDPDELKRYIAQMERDADRSLTADESRLLEEGNMDSIFRYAIGIENDSLQLFKELATHAEHENFREFCEEMVTEESKHASQLENERRSLQLEMEDRPAL